MTPDRAEMFPIGHPEKKILANPGEGITGMGLCLRVTLAKL
jgi:hypothetical protein